jgi:hypothetical protein
MAKPDKPQSTSDTDWHHNDCGFVTGNTAKMAAHVEADDCSPKPPDQ